MWIRSHTLPALNLTSTWILAENASLSDTATTLQNNGGFMRLIFSTLLVQAISEQRKICLERT
jgi:hypothetical protein